MRGITTATAVLCLVPCIFATHAVAQDVNAEVAAHAEAAKQAEANNDFAKAVEEYSLVVKAMPASAQMQSNLGVALYFLGDKQRCLEALHKAIAIQPGLFVPHLFSGFALFQLSQPARSAQQLEIATRINPGDPLAHLWLGYADLSLAKVSESISQLQTAAKLQPENADVWYALGQAYLRQGQDATEELARVAPNGGRLWQLTGEQYLMKGDQAKALTMFQSAAERRPDLVDLRQSITNLGGTAPTATSAASGPQNREEDRLYDRAHEAEAQAQEAFRKISEVAPDSYRAHQVMGNGFAAQGQSAEAINEYRAALNLKPDLPELHASIANNLLRLGKPEEALPEFRAELALQPYSASACEGVGRVLSLMGKDDEAAQQLRQAIKLDHPPLETYLLLGKLELRQKQYSAATTLLEHYVAERPRDSAGWYQLASAFRDSGNTTRMQDALARYKQTSTDAKQRAQAQAEYERLADNQAGAVKNDGQQP